MGFVASRRFSYGIFDLNSCFLVDSIDSDDFASLKKIAFAGRPQGWRTLVVKIHHHRSLKSTFSFGNHLCSNFDLSGALYVGDWVSSANLAAC